MNKPFNSCTALITPYDKNGIDYKNLAYLIDRQLDGGIQALLVNGTTGEPSLLGEDEKWEQIKFVVEYVKGKVPVLVGCGAVSTQKTLENCRKATEIGADYLLVVTPYYNKTSQRGAIEHYICLSENVTTPIIMYNVPTRTGFDLSPNAVIELSRQKNIVALKQSMPDLSRCIDMFPSLSDDFSLLCGDDCLLLPMLSVGASGLISVVSNVCPFFVQKVIEKRDLLDFYTLKTLSDLCFCQTNPIPVKYIMYKLGLINEYYLRLPLYGLSKDDRDKIDEKLPLISELLK